jgi:hypothetical protein
MEDSRVSLSCFAKALATPRAICGAAPRFTSNSALMYRFNSPKMSGTSTLNPLDLRSAYQGKRELASMFLS